VLAKGGPKFAPAPPAANDAEAREVGARYNDHRWTVTREPMTFLALQLSRIPDVGRPKSPVDFLVIDHIDRPSDN
jgi:hypothetical protein